MDHDNHILNNKFYCELCEYLACDKYNFTRHLLTKKHEKSKIIKNNIFENEENKIDEPYKLKNNKQKWYRCKCNKKYKHQTNLNRHKKTNCKYFKNDEDIQNVLNYKELIIKLVNENNKLKNIINDLKQIIEI